MALADKLLDATEVWGTVVPGPMGRQNAAWARQMKAQRALDKLPDPRYSVAPQTLSFYDQAVRESIAPRGMSSIEKGAAYQDIAGITTGNIRNARRLGGGNISGQINASLNNAGVIAATQLAGRDAMLRSQNRMNAYNRLQSTIPQFQNTLNQNVGLDIMKQQAFGAAVRDARMQRENEQRQGEQALLSIATMGATGMPTGAMGQTGQVGQTTTTGAAPVESFQNTTYQQPTWFTPEQPNMLSTENRFTPYNLNPFSPAPPPRYIK